MSLMVTDWIFFVWVVESVVFSLWAVAYWLDIILTMMYIDSGCHNWFSFTSSFYVPLDHVHLVCLVVPLAKT